MQSDIAVTDYHKERQNIRVYGHVYDRLEEYKTDEETFSEAVERLLPWEGEVLEWSEYDTSMVSMETHVHEELVATAGQNVSIPDVLDQYLVEEGYERDEETVRKTELKDVEN